MADKTWQEEFKETLETSVDLSQAIHTVMGFVSVCWEPKPKGVFESDRAHRACEMLEIWIEARYEDRGVDVKPDEKLMAIRSEESIKMEQQYNRQQALTLAIELEKNSPGAADTRLERITKCADAFVKYVTDSRGIAAID